MLVESYRKAHPNSPEVNWCSGEDITIQAASVCYGIGMALMLDASAAKSNDSLSGIQLHMICG